jgi:hypothetical protein
MSRSWHIAAELLSVAKEYGGLEVDQAKRMKELERENVRIGGEFVDRNRGSYR